MFENLKILKAKKKILKEKKAIIYDLTREWSREEIYRGNIELQSISEGFVGGNYTEYDFKRKILICNTKYFTPEEYNYYDEQIKQHTKTLGQKR
ncbi:MAG: hypothetical protein WC343_08535 [Bacilli bacterium]|jgi:hypothetical protein